MKSKVNLLCISSDTNELNSENFAGKLWMLRLSKEIDLECLNLDKKLVSS